MANARISRTRLAFVHVALIIYAVIALFSGRPDDHELVQDAQRHLPLAADPAAAIDVLADRLSYGSRAGRFRRLFPELADCHGRVDLLRAPLRRDGAFALSEYRFRGNLLMGLYLALGIMIPIRLGTIGILQEMVALNLVNTLVSLVLVYTAQGLPLAVFILSEFMRTVSDDLKSAGRIDGLSEYAIFFRLVLPLVRPAMATVAVFTMIPIWNDLWFPLILAPGEKTKTVTLGHRRSSDSS